MSEPSDPATPRERFLSVLSGDPSDSPPIFLRDLTLGLDALDVGTNEVFGDTYDSQLSAECVLALQRRMGHDAVVGSIHSYGLEAFGGKTVYPDRGIPYLTFPPFADFDMMERYEPDDIRDGLLEGMRGSYRIVRERAPHLAVIMNIGGPVNTAGNLRGLEQFMMDVILNPDIVGELMEFSEGVITSTVGYIGPEAADAVFLAAASDNPDMLGLDEYSRISLPCVENIADFCHIRGLPVIMHPHGLFSTGDRKGILRETIDTGIDGFQFAEDNSPEGILAETRGRCCTMGGLDAFTTLFLGPQDRIRKETEAMLDVMAGEDYIMTCSCSLNRGLPLDNVEAMVSAAKGWKKQ